MEVKGKAKSTLPDLRNTRVVEPIPDRSTIVSAAQRNYLDFLQVDLDLCFTFVKVATTKMQMEDWPGAERSLRNAEAGYATIQRLLMYVNDEEQRIAVDQRLFHLRTSLDQAVSELSAQTSTGAMNDRCTTTPEP